MPTRIPLTRGTFATVDDADADLVSAFKWHATSTRGLWYARREIGGRAQMMHSLLVNSPLVDHVNGNGLDNRRSNLRPATPAQNMQNRMRFRTARSQFKGLLWCHRDGRWRARITVIGKRIDLGRFSDERDAALAYDMAARQHFGEFAALNFPRGPGERSALSR